MRRKLLVLIPLILLVLAAAAVAGTWLWAARALEQSYTAWLEERRADGWTFDNAVAEVGGFPVQLTARLAEPRVVAPQGWAWQAPDVAARASVLDPFTVRFTAPGRHEAITPTGRELVADAAEAQGRVLFGRGGARSGQMTLSEVSLTGLPPGDASAEALFVALGPLRRPDGAPQELDFTLETDGLELPPQLKVPFGRRIAHLRARGTTVGALPRRWTAGDLRAWRARGGEIALDHLELDWAPVTLSGDGTLSLDRELRPQGELAVQVTGLGAALDRLAESGRVEPRMVAYAKLAISALGSTDDSGRTRVQLQIRFREGRLYLGPVPLLPLPSVLR